MSCSVQDAGDDYADLEDFIVGPTEEEVQERIAHEKRQKILAVAKSIERQAVTKRKKKRKRRK